MCGQAPGAYDAPLALCVPCGQVLCTAARCRGLHGFDNCGTPLVPLRPALQRLLQDVVNSRPITEAEIARDAQNKIVVDSSDGVVAGPGVAAACEDAAAAERATLVISLVGSAGTGKSQLIRFLLDNIAEAVDAKGIGHAASRGLEGPVHERFGSHTQTSRGINGYLAVNAGTALLDTDPLGNPSNVFSPPDLLLLDTEGYGGSGTTVMRGGYAAQLPVVATSQPGAIGGKGDMPL